MWKSLERGSSPVDWCEGNYRVSPVIAEFVNTVSNVLQTQVLPQHCFILCAIYITGKQYSLHSPSSSFNASF